MLPISAISNSIPLGISIRTRCSSPVAGLVIGSPVDFRRPGIDTWGFDRWRRLEHNLDLLTRPKEQISGKTHWARDEKWWITDGNIQLALHHNDDCGISFVATVPEARRRGLATEVMRQALRDARDNGCTTTTLQATDLGERLYANLGYRRLCAMQLWELRR